MDCARQRTETIRPSIRCPSSTRRLKNDRNDLSSTVRQPDRSIAAAAASLGAADSGTPLMPGVTIKIEETVLTGDELVIDTPNIKHGDVDTDALSLVVDDKEIPSEEVSFSVDISREQISILNLTDRDWDVGDTVTLAWPDKDAA
jgi:hypothetical protein